MLAKSISGAAAAASPAYIEDVFSTYLYTGNGSTQTITNGIDLSGKGGLVWTKDRTGSAATHQLIDTVRGINSSLKTQNTDAAAGASDITSFNANGFSLGYITGNSNFNNDTYVSWAFRKQAKFFDVVTYTGNGVAGRQISHSLGSAPGAIIVKCTNIARDWAVWQNTLSNGTYLKLNTTDAVITNTGFQVFGDASGQTSTYFTVGKSGSLGVNGLTNANGDTYVAYLFAHDAGGFGLTGTDNVISCGSYTTDGSGNATVTLGYEPQWILIKPNYAGGNWWILDTMRGFVVNAASASTKYLKANSSDAELDSLQIRITNTGFVFGSGALNSNFIYIAIRRGPMKVPTSGTSVFTPVTYTAGSSVTVTSGFPVDLFLARRRNANSSFGVVDRLRGGKVSGPQGMLFTDSVFGEPSNTYSSNGFGLDSNTSAIDNFTSFAWGSGSSIGEAFRRAPGFFDVVAYTGTSVARTVNHNLAAVPEMMIVRRRDAVGDWRVYDAATGNTKYHVLNTNGYAATSSTAWNNTTPTSSVFSLGTSSDVNASGSTYIAYLFATCPGVSKVGSYTGTGTTKQIDCGFTGGARFVLIKRTDNDGDWYVWDTARGIVSGNDPYLLLNSTAAEVTSTDYIDTYSAGFEISSTAPAAINANGGTFIFLAIA